ncbi:MAG: fibronectin type III domain-containing protein [Desulfobacteraceae bacterium]|nr:fibronectin type III domain-containing protein [Desulfobacteraceae bacterium]MBC2752908.1 fibronectin type III domain-containing protein [Desulfobacteraceae bacterium]
MGKWNRRHTLLSLVATLTLLVSPAVIQAETLVWDASSGTVEGYNVYYGTTPSDQSAYRDVGNTTQLDLNNLPLSEGVTYYLCVSAYNSVGESPPCAPVVFTPGDNTPPLPPIGLTTE